MAHLEQILQAIAQAEAALERLDQNRFQVVSELQKLRTRHAALVAGKSNIGVLDQTTDQTTKYSSPENKIHLFADLFRGRQDVFARYWFSQKSGKKGYSPVCEYEWQPGICTKPEKKCAACKYTPLTHEILRAHLEGKNVVGIYPLLQDETCCFLAVDFDGEGWQQNTKAFLETCQTFRVPAALERSRSGNGGHVWIFFVEPVAAALARSLGSYLLTETMNRRHQLGMESYDRLFPNQDTMPKGGFGNLIALPLQKEARKLGNTEFLNEQFQPHADQWAYLASIQKMGFDEVHSLVNAAAKQNNIMGAEIGSHETETIPWKAVRKNHLEHLRDGRPRKIKVTIANRLYIETENLPSALLAEIKRLASFQNQKFYEAQRVRRSTFRIPRIISCAEDFVKYLAIPRGCWEALHALTEPLGITLEICDERFVGAPIEIEFRVSLTENQKKAVASLSHHDMGMFVAPPGSGKTAVGVYLLALRKVSTLILVHRKPLMEQWQNRLVEFLRLDPSQIGQIGGGKDSRTGKIDIAMLQSMVRKGKVDSVVNDYGNVIIDECHHIPAFSFEQVLKQIRARYVTGLTATPYRRDGLHPIINMYCGSIRHQLEHKAQVAVLSFQQRLVTRRTDFILPENRDFKFHEILQLLAEDDHRNDLIVADVLKALEEKKTPLLLSERRQHIELLRAKLEHDVKYLFILHGGLNESDRLLTQKMLTEIPQNQSRLILATGSYIGEGFDDPRLDTLFLAMPISFKGKLLQYIGRILRPHGEKEEICVYDYVDTQVPMLAHMFKKRLTTYRTLRFEGDEIAKKMKRSLVKAGILEIPKKVVGL